MARSFVHVLIVAFVFCFASAESHSTAAFATPHRIKNPATAFAASPSHIAPIQQPTPQASEIRLTPGVTHDQQILRDEIQSFAVELGAGQCVEVGFEWFGMNLGIAVFDPDGKKLLPSDPTLSSNGPLSISILADKAGAYRLKVKPLVNPKIRGKYRVTLRAPRVPSDEDRTRFEAQIQISKAQSAQADAKIDGLNKAVALLESISEANGAARTLMLLGDAYREARDFNNAKTSYKRAAEIWKLSTYQRGEGYAYISVGLLNRSGSLLEAEKNYKQAHDVFEHIGDVRGQADALFGESTVLMLSSQPSQAIPLLERVAQLRRSNGDLIGEANSLNMMGDAYRKLGEAEKSFELFDQVTKLLDGLEHRSLEAALIINRAIIYADQGDWERAKDEYARSLTIYEKILGQSVLSACAPTPKDLSICRSAAAAIDNLGQAYTSLGQFERSLQELGDALSIRTALKNKTDQGTTTLHIGYAKFLMGRPREALTDYKNALTLQEEARNPAEIALTNSYIGLAHTSLNEPEVALRYFNEALRFQRTGGDKRALAITLDNLGMAQHLTGNSQDALTNFSSALALWRTVKDPNGEALTLYHTAAVQAETGDLSAANQSSEGAIKLVESLRTRLRSERSRTAYLAERQEYYKLDVDLKMRLSKLGQRETYVTTAFETNERGRTRVLLDSLAEADVVRSARGKASSSRLESLRDQHETLEKQLAAKAAARTALIINKSSDKQIATIEKEIADLSQQYDELEQAIKSEDPRFASLVRPQPASLSQIQRQLDSDTLQLEYSLGDSRSYVWAVTANSIGGFELRPRKEIEAAAVSLNTALTERNRIVKNETARRWQRRIRRADADYDKAAAALSEMVLKPVAALLGDKRLVIVADGALQLVSFAALPVPATTEISTATSIKVANSRRARRTSLRIINDDHEVVFEPSASVFVLQRRELENRAPAPYAVAVLANPVFEKDDPRVGEAIARSKRGPGASPEPKDVPPTSQKPTDVTGSGRTSLRQALDDLGLTRFPALPNSNTEARSIVKAAGQAHSKIALNFEANRATAMSPELSNYRTIHFATHSVADFVHPDLSGIVLSMVDEKGEPQDGHLRLRDIYNLNLPADLVVLSACQTAVGKQIRGEGLIALTRGFMYAGAQRVVASLWKVDDAATADLMAEFYDQMLTKKLTPAAALRAAQQKISRQPARKSPYFWAGFVLQGEWK